MKLNEGSGPAYVVILGRFMTNIGFFMVMPFLTIYVTQSAGMSTLQAGVLFAVLNFTRRGLGIPAGWASDRFGPSRMLVLGLLIEVVAYLSFNLAGHSFVGWLVAVAILGAGGSLNNNGSRSLLAAAKTGGVVVNLARYYVSINGAALIGPLIGSLLLAHGLIWTGFIVTAGLHLVFAVVSAILLRGMAKPVSGAAPIRARDMVVALHDRHLMLYCGLAVGGWFLITQYRIALPLTLLHQHLAPELIGPLTSVNAIVVMIAVTIIGKRAEKRGTIGRFDVLALGALVLGGGWLLCALTGLAPIIAAVIVTSIGESLFCGVVDAMAAQLAPTGSVGLYLGYSAMAWGVGGAIGGIIGGGFGLAAQHNELIVFWLLLALIGVASAVGTRLCRPYLATAIEERAAATAAAKVAAE